MNTLFPVEPDLPEGFAYYPNFINEIEEQKLVQVITKQNCIVFYSRDMKLNAKWQALVMAGVLKKELYQREKKYQLNLTS